MGNRYGKSQRKNSTLGVVEHLERRLFLHHGDSLTHYHFLWVGGPGNWQDTSHWISDRPAQLPPATPTQNDTVSIPASAGEVTVSGTRPFHSGTINSNIRLESGSLLIAHGNNVTLNGTMTFAGGTSEFQIYAAAGGASTFDGSGTIAAESGRAAVSSRFGMTIGAGLTFNYGAPGGHFNGPVTSLATMNLSSGIVSHGPAERFTNRGTINLNSGQLQLNGQTWTNQGTINQNGGSLFLGGTFRQSDLGNHIRNGGTVTAAGTLLGNLTLDATTGSWNVTGTLKNGRYSAREGAAAVGAFTLDNYTLGSDLTVGSGTSTIINNLTLDTTTLRVNGGATVRALTTTGTSLNPSIIGSGRIELNGGAFSQQNVIGGNQIFTIGSDIKAVVTGGSFGGFTSSTKLELRGALNTAGSGQSFAISVANFDLYGDITLVSGSSLFLQDANGTFNILDGGSITMGARSVFETARGLNVSSSNPGRTRSPGYLTFFGGTAAVPKLIEVAGQDLGPVAEGFKGPYGVGVLRHNGTHQRFVDNYDNTPGAGSEALYADSLINLFSSQTLDLNGQKLYVRAMEGAGLITNGTVTLVPDSGPIVFALPTSGRISAAGQTDDWTFFGRAGQQVSLVLNPTGNPSAGAPGALNPLLVQGKVSLLTPTGTVIGTAQSPANHTIATLANVTLPVDGTYSVRVQAAVAALSTGHYKLSVYDVSVRRQALLLNRVTSGNIDTPFAADEWTFSLSAGQQVQFDLLNTANSGLRYTLSGPNGYVPFNNITGDSGLITIPGGNAGQYTLRVQGTTDETGAYSFVMRDTSVTSLTLGTPYAGVLPGSGSPQWFKVNLPSPGQLLVTLDDSTTADRNQLFIRKGAPPTLETFDYRHATYDADEQIYIPNATAGEWHILVYGSHVPAASTYTLEAKFDELRVTSYTPDRYGVENTMTMTLNGGGFETGTTVKLIGGATTLIASNVEIDSSTQLTATFDLSGTSQRVWDLRVERAALSFTKVGAFTTLPNLPAKLETKVIVPTFPTRVSVSTGRIEYANTGNVAMPAPLLILQSGDPQRDQFPILSLDLSRQIEEFWSAVLPPGTSHRLMMLGSGEVPGVLNPGERLSIPYNYLGEKVPFDPTDTFLELELLCVADDAAECDCDAAGETINWGALKPVLQPPGVPGVIWDDVYARITSPLDTVEDYASALVENAKYLGRAGVRVVDVDEIWNFQVQQALGTITAVSTLAASVDAQLPAPGAPMSFTRRFADGVLSRNVMGAFGYGWTSPWFATLSRNSGNDLVTISDGSSQRIFVRDNRGSSLLSPSTTYFSAAGDSSKLRRVGTNIFELRDSAGGSVTRFRADGKVDYVQDANGNRSSAAYNSAGELVTLTHTSGAIINFGYNAAGRITSLTDSLGRSKTYAYDASSEHLMSISSPDGSTVNYTYESGSSSIMRRHALLTEESAGATHAYTYDAQGRISSSGIVNGAPPTTFAYELGRITLNDVAGAGQLYFDHRLRLARVTNALGNNSRMIYDANSRLTTIILPDESQQKYEWCDCGSLDSAADALGYRVSTTRDPITRNVTSIVDANGNTTRFTYDAAGNQVALVYPDGKSEYASNFLSNGLPQTFTTRSGKTTSVVYNAGGQITQRTSPNGAITDYVYDARGRLTTITQGMQVITRTYDTANDGDRLKRITYTGGKFVEYDYDIFGRQIAERDQSGFTTRFEYDAAGRLAHVRDTAGVALSIYAYDAADRILRVDNANGTFTTYGYDAAGNVLSVQNWRSVGVLNSQFIYAYDKRGRRISAVTTDGTWNYGYDAASQLTSATFSSTSAQVANQNIQISYDAAGNRTFANINGTLIDYGINALNQYTSVDGIPFTYDADGNLLSDGTSQFAYDDFNRLIRVQSGADTQEFEYNPTGGRTASIVNGVRTSYLLAPDMKGTVLAEYDAIGALAARNLYGASLIARTDGAGVAKYYDFDLVGSTAGMTDTTGTYVNRYVYDPFGKALFTDESVSNPYQFTGQLGGRSGVSQLVRMGLRDYSAGTGRFTTIDPLRLADDSNVYQYAGSSPVMNTDPTGLFGVILTPIVGKSGLNAFGKPLMTAATDDLGDLAFSVGVDSWQGLAIAAQTGNYPTTQDAGWAALTSYALNAAFSAPGLNGFANGIQLAMDPQVNENFVNAACGLALQRQFGSLNIGAAKQLAALEAETGGGGPNTVNPACLNGFPKSGDADIGIGDPCASGIVNLAPRPFDPNDKIPIKGFGPDNRVLRENAIEYTVDYENLGPGSEDENGDPYPIVAAVPAQRVAIDDRLSSNLDWSTVEFTEFAFGETIVPVTGALGPYSASIPTNTNGIAYIVQIDALVDIATGVLSVIFQAIDPITGLPPTALVGVVAPEDGSGNGMGHFKFSVKPLSTVPDGTAIRNVAIIQFDANDVIPTNQVDPLDPTQGTSPAREALVTIDAAPPGAVGAPEFLVDAPAPSITVQFSENVSPGLQAADLVVTNTTTLGTFFPASVAFATNSNTATFRLTTALPDGDYELEIIASNITDGVGRPMQADINGSFFHFAGDANRDRVVDIDDFAIVAGRFNQPGTFSQGDFDYDGLTDISDFAVLASKFNTSLPSLRSIASIDRSTRSAFLPDSDENVRPAPRRINASTHLFADTISITDDVLGAFAERSLGSTQLRQI